VSPVPPYKTPILEVAPTTPLRTSSGPFNPPASVRMPALLNDDVAVRPTYKPSSVENRVEDAYANERRSVDESNVNAVSPPKVPLALNCTSPLEPPGEPLPPAMPRLDVATRS